MAKRIQARIAENLIDLVDDYFDGSEDTRYDPDFLALADRIAGKIVTLRFIGEDAFEVIDDRYWLPDCCWEKVETIDG